MGTRADFWIGKGDNAEWLGSVGWDGYEWDNPDSTLMKAKTATEFRDAVAMIAAERSDFTFPNDGWPWPWNTSNLTDLAYVFVDDAVTIPRTRVDWFPNMASVRNVVLDEKSGLLSP